MLRSRAGTNSAALPLLPRLSQPNAPGSIQEQNIPQAAQAASQFNPDDGSDEPKGRLRLASICHETHASEAKDYHRPGGRLGDGRFVWGPAAHRTLHFGTVLTVQKGSRSLQVTVTDCGPFTGAFLDLSPAAASALGCRCTHRNVSATVMQMGSGATAAAGRGPQRSLAAVPMPLFQPRGTACIHWECSDPQWPWLLSRGPSVATVFGARTDPNDPLVVGRRRDAPNDPSTCELSTRFRG